VDRGLARERRTVERRGIMTNRTKRLTAAGMLPLAALVLAVAGKPAVAQQPGEPTALQRALGAIGLLEIPEAPIVYREREPLVVPPTTGLIVPRDSGDISRINPDWPVDHDAERDRVDLEEIKRGDEQFYSGRPLTPAELDRARISREEAARRDAKSRTVTTAGQEAGEGRERYSPSQLGFRGWGTKQEEAPTVFGGEPARTSLIMPPSEYFRPSDKAPFGVVTKASPRAKSTTIYDRTSAPEDPSVKR
jgi:hypothetical protein